MEEPRMQITAAPALDGARTSQKRQFGRFGARPNVGAGAAAKIVAEDASALVRAEIELAKAEVTEALRAKAVGSGALVVAAVFAWLALQALLVAAGFALALVVPGWAAALIVAGALLLFAGIGAAVGRAKLRAPLSLETTKRNVTEDVRTAKAHLPRAGNNGEPS